MDKYQPNLEEFLELPTQEVAKIVRASGSKVVVFPVNGTRRWFVMEYGEQEFTDPVISYLDISMRRHIELYKLFFSHGVDTLLTPVIGPEILETREAYMQKIGAEGLARLAIHPELLTFYKEFDVKVRFYGEYRKYLVDTVYEYLIELFDQVTEKTKKNSSYRLFFGAFADQIIATEALAKFVVQYFSENGNTPSRKEIVEMYYGEYLQKADIFIGFDRFSSFDYPLLNWGGEDLYFMVAPSSYLNDEQLREILYDHIYTRGVPEYDFMSSSGNSSTEIKNFYYKNRNLTLGTGHLLNGTWIPKLIKNH